MAQLLWVLDHLDDIESDLSAIHRVDDMHDLPARRFFLLAERLPAYQGALQARLSGQHAEAGETTPAPDRPEAQRVPTGVAPAHQGFAGDGAMFPPVFEVRKAKG